MPYYIRHQDQKLGPFSEAQLTAMLLRGTVTPDTETSQDEIHWKTLDKFPQFEKHCTETIEETSASAVIPPVVVGYGPKKQEDDILALSDFSPEKSQKMNAIAKQVADEARMKTIMAGIVGLGLLVCLVLFVFSGKKPSFTGKTNDASKRTPLAESYAAETSLTEAEAKKLDRQRRAAEARIAAEKARRERQEARAKAAERERQGAEVKGEANDDAENESMWASDEMETKTSSNKINAKSSSDRASSAELKRIVASLKKTFSVRHLALDTADNVTVPKSVETSFHVLYPIREQISLKYVSYAPSQKFSSDNESPYEVMVSHDGENVLRLALEENGLTAEWIDSPNTTPDSYKTINGALLGELEIIQTDTKKILKTVSLFDPIRRKESFAMLNRQILAHDLDLHFGDLGVTEDNIQVVDIKNLSPGEKHESVCGDTMRYIFIDNGKEYNVDVKAIAKTPAKFRDGLWCIPIEPEVSFTPSPEDIAMINNMKSFLGRSENTGAETKFNIETETGAGFNVTMSIVSYFETQFLAQSAALNRRNTIAYKRYTGVVRNFRERLDKVRKITMPEPIAFKIVLLHPIDVTKELLLVEVGNRDDEN